MKKRSLTAVLLSVCILVLPVLSNAQENVNLKDEIRGFNLLMMDQYAASDWQSDPNSGANIIKRDQEEMEKKYRENSTYSGGSDYSYSGGSGDGLGCEDWEAGDMFLMCGILGLLGVLVAVPLMLIN